MVGVASNYIAANEKGPATASAEVAFAVAEHMHHRLSRSTRTYRSSAACTSPSWV